MTRINLNSSNVSRTTAGPREFLAWGKTNFKTVNAKQISTNIRGNVSALIFAAVLIVCSVSVGCSSDKPKPVSSSSQIPVTQATSPVAPTPAPTVVAENKPAAKKIVHKKPATVNYTDKNYGVNFEYPRRYAIETGDAAADLLTSSPVPMNFVQPGGVALAAVELPETGFANTDFASAFFDVSVHKGLTADQCSEFAVPQPKVIMTAATNEGASTQVAPTQSAPAAESQTASATSGTTTSASSDAKASDSTSADSKASDSKTSTDQANVVKASNDSAAVSSTSSASVSSPASQSSASEGQGSKLMIGDLELRATEAVSGEGTRQSDAKYFHVYQNGACYEFAVNVTTMASSDGLIKHVDRDKVFNRLEQILSTVKIDELKPAAAPETASEVPAAAPTQENPAQ
jgi:hypothetical protein